jgi:hypothetical protein
MFVTLCGSLALLARLLTAALLLAGLLSRRLILLAGLVLFRHGVSFHGKQHTRPTARSSGSFLTKKKMRLEFRDHHTNTQSPPNEQAGTRVSKQPLTTRIIDSVLNKTREP